MLPQENVRKLCTIYIPLFICIKQLLLYLYVLPLSTFWMYEFSTSVFRLQQLFITEFKDLCLSFSCLWKVLGHFTWGNACNIQLYGSNPVGILVTGFIILHLIVDMN